jgi:hypothetical protein
MSKFFETQFHEYVSKCDTHNLHPKMKMIYDKFPTDIQNFQNTIFYGPSGIGKYTQALKSIQKYSGSGLRYEKRVPIPIGRKTVHTIKISDIHYTVNLSLLGCNSKTTWHEIFTHINEIIMTKKVKYGIIMCTEFQQIQSELLEVFYNYMQTYNYSRNGVIIRFVLITTEIGFIPHNILNRCQIISIPRPTLLNYNKCNIPIQNDISVIDDNQNIKFLYANTCELNTLHSNACDNIVKYIIDMDNFKMVGLRELLYILLIHNFNIYDCIWYIVKKLIETNHINNTNMDKIMPRTVVFFQQYNNNYRPIFHLEGYVVFLTNVIHELDLDLT